MPRAVILHGHMFKNAGTTLDWSLRRSFGEGFVDHRDDDAMRNNGEYLATYLREHSSVTALSSHWLPLPVPETPDIKPRVLLLFRHPLERSRSVYKFERAQLDANAAGNKNARALSFRDYVKWRLQPGTGPAIKNFHTRYCSGNYFGKDMAQLYDQALHNLESIPLTGLVHRYGASMVLFEQSLVKVFPDLDLSWKIQNVSQSSTPSLEDKLEDIAEELGDTYSSLIDENKYDMMLFQYIQKRFEHQLSQIPKLGSHLSAMARRNESLT